ncbi:lipid-A-disaccharide synthase-related protein [Dendronalium sp. ChiSLP03b]|uniref:lipid-A-disaccharide synthase-related protein n=1 Tax=Dendronalium sp. ChiSLP03b TaxID=3075381 RepID=UPI002AD43C5C|nr:lipid-A-disaccharide synthase-related protein [Dendronalium sp. ChiSLP03b]MDZ8204224.1 lipid-A-disaccharide synthase-related protein [Dendronalium sp. ChiSLP03b]
MNDVSRSSLASNTPATTSGLQLLVLSNGHGEDIIAVRILQELQQQLNPPDIFALPLVGEGRAYQQLHIPCIGSVRTMPSGGFIYMDGRELIRDVRGGLLQLTFSQIKAIRRWVSSQKRLGNKKAILAVGDIVPLLFANLSGANYAFVGTAKSEYYVRNEVGLLPRKSKAARWENFSGSIYHPWERWLMSCRRCRAVFPRDSLTTEILKQWSIPAFDLGNPMMDGLKPTVSPQQFYSADVQQQELARPLVITLLPGSRAPEAYTNWKVIMLAVSALMASFQERDAIFHTSGSLVFLGAIAPGLDCNILSQTVQSQGWQLHSESPILLPDPNTLIFKQKNAYLLLTQQAYNECLHWGDVAIAMAGTATEQFVGLGKPAIAIPGDGPQYNPAFAEAQSRLLGPSLILVEQPIEVANVMRSLFKEPDSLQIIAENGMRRMGKPGAARRIAECLLERLG